MRGAESIAQWQSTCLECILGSIHTTRKKKKANDVHYNLRTVLLGSKDKE
jgi:hypothetical protein